MPMDEDHKKTKGYAFIEYSKPQARSMQVVPLTAWSTGRPCVLKSLA